MNRFLLLALMLANCSLSASSGQDALSPSEALSQWETFSKQVDVAKLDQLVAIVSGNTARGNHEVFNRVVAIAQNENQVLLSRSRAVELACEIADSSGSNTILTSMIELWDRNKVTHADGETFDHFVPFVDSRLLTAYLRSARNVEFQQKDHQALLRFLKSYYLSKDQPPRAKSSCVQFIVECNVPIMEQQAWVLDIIETRKIIDDIYPMLKILTPANFPRLRQMVRANQNPGDFIYPAADVLSYFGDQEIVADLEALRPVFRAEHRNLEYMPMRYLWRIDIQHPPTKLLEYISSVEDRGHGREMRGWAIRRAKDIGIDKELIRQAILKHAEDVSTRMQRAGVSDMKKVGLQLDILNANDLPGITLSKRRH